MLTAQGTLANPTLANPSAVDPAAPANPSGTANPGNPAAVNPNTTANGQTAAQNAGQSIEQAGRDLQNRVTPDKVERAAEHSAKGAWGTLAALVLGLLASLGGSYLGARDPHHTVRTTTLTGGTLQRVHRQAKGSPLTITGVAHSRYAGFLRWFSPVRAGFT